MEFLKDCEICDIRNDSDVLLFTCLQRDEGKVTEVKWSKGDYDAAIGRIVPTDEKTQTVNDWCKEYFDLDLLSINKAIGKKIDVYVYENFASFWEADAKYKPEDVGSRFDTEIEEVQLNNDAIVIRYFWNGTKYRTNYRFTQKVGEHYFVNPQKKRRQIAKFEDMFGIPIERKDELVGLPVTIEVKKAYKNFAYGDLSVKS